ncbi:uncharacterized protein LOC131008327 [Salvia miltiorrhiza]|uniref:uncharacterized protein LOC131008327 n=1 Tax=Salvia miltiorrhiza TaxID=226208 RepID=UPI0025ABC5B3|nr:uncharacterized protein LOC131008327 [Salvia miltiorrhiza]
MSASGEASSAPNTVVKSNDPGWKHCVAVGPGTNKVKCLYCGKVMNFGITRGKEHLIGKRGKVAPCKQAPPSVRTELLEYYQAKENEKKGTNPKDIDLGFGFDDEEDESATQTPSARSCGTSQPIKKGSIEMFLTKTTSSKDKGKQTNIRGAIDKEAVARVHQYIARFWYQAGLSFNLVKLDAFQNMIEAIGAFGRNLPAPSYHSIRVPLLNKELEYTNNLLEKNKEEWGRHGCSIMSDGWTDRKQRTIINFSVNSPSGTVFVKSIDGSAFVKTGDKLFELLDELVEEIGEENVVQVLTDNGSNYVAAGKMLMEKRRHLYWTPCAAHCIDLMLEDIGKLPQIKTTIQRGVKFVGFIYNHTSTLSLLRRFTNKRELVRPAVTRFATSFLSLERIHKEKTNLRKMFTSEEWTQNKLSKEAKGKQATKIALMPSFWKNIVYTLKVMAPLVRVLRLVDGEKKPAMGYIYEAMEKAKEAIAKSFQNNESRYKEVFAIIDNRWDCQLHRPLHAAVGI